MDREEHQAVGSKQKAVEFSSLHTAFCLLLTVVLNLFRALFVLTTGLESLKIIRENCYGNVINP